MMINYDEPITFGRSGSARRLTSSGIDFSEDGGQSWTDASVAALDIQLPFARQEVVLEIDANPFVVPKVVHAQNVFIFLGGLFTSFLKLSGHVTSQLFLPRGSLIGRPVRLSLVIPTAVSPASLDMSNDERALGICLEHIVFKTAS